MSQFQKITIIILSIGALFSALTFAAVLCCGTIVHGFFKDMAFNDIETPVYAMSSEDVKSG